jgi:alkaline phosphatase
MDSSTSTSRRQFLKLSGLAGAASFIPASQMAGQSVKSAASVGKAMANKPAKNLIFLVVDGLCNGTVGLAHHWKLRNEGAPLNWISLFEQEGLQRAYQDTASASSPVTDSAAAASAWGSGQRVNNGSINTDPSGRSNKPVLRYAKEAGKATGLVSTCRITHATPAGFVATVPERGDEDAIARQYLEHDVDVLLGGGSRHFKQTQADGSVIDYAALFEEKGYELVTDAAGLAAASSQSPLLGLFSKSHIPYAIDRQNDEGMQGVPGLADMFRAALRRLDGMKDGFVLQVEGGRVDHAGHGNDPAAILNEFLEFDACIPIALEYIDAHPDTMLIVTTDHGTGGCQLNGAGEAYVDAGPALDRINEFSYSFEWLQHRFSKTGKFDAEAVKIALGLEATAAQAAIVQAALDAEAKYLSGALNEAFGAQIKELTAVGWTSSNHTSECTDFFAFGPGSQAVPPFIKNYEVFALMTTALGFRV